MSHSINHHPDGATLMSFAAAALAEPLAAVVAAHISLCPRCRAEVADLERLGAAVMLSAVSASESRPLASPSRTVVTQFPAKPRRALAASAHDRLPSPIAAAYDLSFETIPWKRLGPGVWHHRLPLLEEAAGDLRLLRIGPGRRMPEHGHGGAELTLVLSGAYSDVTGTFAAGDVQDVDEGIEHQPVVADGEDCVCLIASEHPARFKSVIGRLMQPWTGL